MEALRDGCYTYMPWLLQWEKGGEVAGDAGTERWMLYLM